MGIPKLLALLLVPTYVVLIAVLDTLQIQAVFEPPLLLLVLNTLLLGIVPVAVAYIAGRVYLKTGSSSILLTGCGMLTFGLCAMLAGWLIGMPGGPNMTVTMHNTGAFVGAFFLALGSILNRVGRKSPDQWPKGKRTITTAYGCVCIFVVIFTFSTVKGFAPSFFIQGVGPTVLRQAVLAAAVILFVLSSAFSMHTYAQWKSDFLYWYSLGLAFIAIGLSAVFLQHAVGSPIGWLGRSAQYLGGVFSLVAIVTALRTARFKGLPIERVIANFLADAEANYRDLVESARDAIISFDQEGRIIGWNSTAETMFGHTKGQAIALPFFEFLIPEPHVSVFKEEIRQIAAQPKKSLSGRLSEIEAQRRDGSVFPIEVSASVRELPTGRVTTCIIRDVTERKRGEQKLQEREERLSRISSMISDIAYSCTKPPAGPYSIDWLTGGAEHLTGYSVDDIKSLGCWRALVLDEDLPVFDHNVIGLAPGTKGSCELRLRHKTGGIVRIASFAECFVDAAFPDSLRLYGGWVDITDRKLAEKKLLRQRKLVDAINLVLRESLESETDADIARTCLRVAEEITGSRFGFIGEVNEAGRLDTIAVSDPGWKACRIPESNSPSLIRHVEIRGIWGSVLKGEQSLIINDPASHPDSVGVPDGHPSLSSFVGVPLKRSGKTFGLVALANKEGGYDPSDVADVEALSSVFVEALDRKRAERALHDSEEKYRHIFENSIEGIFQSTPDERFITVNPAFARMFGYDSPEEMVREVTDIPRQLYARPEEWGNFKQSFDDLGSLEGYEVECRRKDETPIWVSVNARAIRDDSGRVLYYEGTSEDVTRRKHLTQALLASETRYRRLFEAARDGILILDWGTARIVDVNPFMNELLGYSREEMLEKKLWEIGLFEDIAKSQAVFAELQSKQYVRYEDLSLQTIGGEVINVEFVSNVYMVNGAKVIQCNIRDITERSRAGEALASEKKRFEALAESSPFGMVMIRQDGFFEYTNPKFHEMFGYDLSEIPTGRELFRKAYPDPDYRHEVIAVWLEDLAKATPDQLRPRIFTVTCKDGTRKIIHFRPVLLPSGENLVTCEDITLRQEAEEAIRKSEEKYRTLFEDSIDPLFMTIADGTLIDANQAYFDLLGYEKEEIVGHSVIKTYADPADRPRYLEALLDQGFVKDYPLRLVRKDGWQLDCLLSSRIERDKDRNILSARGFIRDITEQKNLQRQLLQAQKMEAIGTLAGGIAHDFNNLLTVVQGFSELLLAEKNPNEWDYADLQKIFHAARNGADLVQRLLMFSRKSEPKPLPINLNKQIVQVEKLLRRTIPKMIDIQLELSADLPDINADPSQVEQVLMNLAVNARDAMPADGGKLTVATQAMTLDEEHCSLCGKVVSGDYVLLEVSDTGRGIDKETVGRIFEPFFTTKEMGRGTGLGLAMVYGVVHQHNGHIIVYSEVGKGTTFKIYLPAIQGEVETDVETTAIMPAFGTETVLLVDDEDLVRDLGTRILTKQGYTVLKAADGREALDVFGKESSRISLVILDLIMPEMGGKECLKEILRIDPQVKVLVASGYSADASVKETIQMGAKGFVNKPFRVNELLRGVRKVLDGG